MVKQTAGHDALGEFAPEFSHLNDDVLFDVVEIPADTKRWHGVKRDGWFSHLAFEQVVSFMGHAA